MIKEENKDHFMFGKNIYMPILKFFETGYRLTSLNIPGVVK